MSMNLFRMEEIIPFSVVFFLVLFLTSRSGRKKGKKNRHVDMDALLSEYDGKDEGNGKIV